ncbi:MAG: hypothetical protein Q8R86_09700 [Sulfuricurvum sp.]|nr:hypothetical protein [Sulfuricurvum sp.]
MAKSYIVNRLNGKSKTYAVPTTAVNAQTFATTFLDGEFAIYEPASIVGSDVVAVAPTLFNVMFKDTTTDMKGYASLLVPANKTENDLFTAMMGLTLNGVHIDYVSTMSQRVAEQF